jgi:hypothetical protein
MTVTPECRSPFLDRAIPACRADVQILPTVDAPVGYAFTSIGWLARRFGKHPKQSCGKSAACRRERRTFLDETLRGARRLPESPLLIIVSRQPHNQSRTHCLVCTPGPKRITSASPKTVSIASASQT